VVRSSQHHIGRHTEPDSTRNDCAKQQYNILSQDLIDQVEKDECELPSSEDGPEKLPPMHFCRQYQNQSEFAQIKLNKVLLNPVTK